MTTLLRVLEIINYFFIALVSIGFLPQFFYIILTFLKPKSYKKSQVKHTFGVVIAARNEEKVIAETINSIKNQNYPEDKIKIFVICHNCTDNTAEVATKAGAEVLINNSDKERRKGYALKYAFNNLLNRDDGVEGYFIFDADSLMHPDFVSEMNNAFDSGVQIARGYCNSKNYNQNIFSSITSLYAIRDNRFNCRARSALNTSQVLIGSGMMISRKTFDEIGGWDCTSISEDAEFTLKRIAENKKIEYVNDAIYYDEMQYSLKETFQRTRRMGYGLVRLFFSNALPMLGKFFCTFKYVYLDMFLNFLFIPVAAIACTWFPIYYIFLISYCVLSGNILMLYEIGMLILYIVVFAFLIPFILQGFLAIILERKRILVKNFRSLVPSAIFFPLFMLIYAVSITCGVFSYNCKWETNRHAKSISVDKLLADNYGADNSCEKSETVKSSDTEEDEAFTDVLSVTSQSKDLAADKTTNINNTDDGFKSI